MAKILRFLEEQSQTADDGATVMNSNEVYADNFGLICTVLSCGIAGYQILQHLRFYNQPAIQLQIIRILTMIPVSFIFRHTDRHSDIQTDSK